MSRNDDREMWIPAPRRITVPSESAWFHGDLMFAVFAFAALAAALLAINAAIDGRYDDAVTGSGRFFVALGGAKLNRDFNRMRKWTPSTTPTRDPNNAPAGGLPNVRRASERADAMPRL